MSTKAPQGTADALLEVAERNVGFIEGPRNNENPYAAVAGHANFQPWCATFLVACARRAGVSIPSESAYTPTMANGFKKIGRYDQNPRRGDFVFFFWPNMGRIAHVGVVASVNADGSVNTVEGNTNSGGSRTGGGVFRLVRRSHIDGFGHPEYGEAPAQPDAPAEPKTIWVKGDKGPEVVHIQTRLRVHGHNVDIDGDFGPQTHAAVVAFGKANGLAGTGRVGPTTLALLDKTPAASQPAPKPQPKPARAVKTNPYPVPVLSRQRPVIRASSRKTKTEVQYIQWACGAAPDGQWGRLTTAAVRNFQRRHRLTVDAQVGPQTLEALKRVTR